MQRVGRFKKHVEDTVASVLVIVFLGFVAYMNYGGLVRVVLSRVALMVLSYVPLALTLLVLALAVLLYVKLRRSSHMPLVRNPRDRVRTSREVGRKAKEIT